MNDIETRSLSKLIRNDETPNRNPHVEHYLIPSYQRGYRWIANIHVDALLEDIDNFIRQQSAPGAKLQSYCLQPIVVVEQKDNNNDSIWEIIDGQQRLTTIFLILKCLNQECFKISFEKRKKSGDFLNNLTLLTMCHDYPDEHFMSEAYKYIWDWFENKKKIDVGYKWNFTATLLNKVEVIWYNVKLLSTSKIEQEAEKIGIFNRLNIGKIPLEDAELVRALLMSKVKGSDEHEKIFKQAELSNEWYAMEQWLRQDSVWNFLTDKVIANHIQLIFELQAHNKNSNNYNTYKWFEKLIQDPKAPVVKAAELWRETKNIFGKLHYWYTDRRLYHLIGFLLSTKRKNLSELLELSNCDKTEFRKKIENLVADFIDSVDPSELNYDGNHQELINYLLLFNVLSTEQIKSDNNLRFPFNLYNQKKWSLEHIHAQQSQNPFKNIDSAKSWIQETLPSIEHIDHIEKDVVDESGSVHQEPRDIRSLVDKLRKMDNDKDLDLEEFDAVRSEIVAIFESPSTKHQLENMALLTTSDNSGLNNSIFPVKRDKLIAKYKEGKFIPPCTLNVFLKFYSKSNSQPYYWGRCDKQYYVTEINRVIETFKKEIQHE